MCHTHTDAWAGQHTGAYCTWLCLGGSLGLCVLLQDQCRTITSSLSGATTVWSKDTIVWCRSCYCCLGDMRGRLLNYICPGCYYSNWCLELWSHHRAFLRMAWHPPRPPKHDRWESWRAWIIWGQRREKKKKLGCCCLWGHLAAAMELSAAL